MITQIDVNGKTMFVHTAWSDDPEGGGMVTTEPEDADYIGTCTDSSSEEVEDPARYTWRYADVNANLDDSDDEFEEDEEDDDGAIDDGMEDVESSLQEVAGRIDTQGMDMVNTTNVTDSAIGNANELEGTNKGKTGWTVPDGFTMSEQSEDVDGNPDTDPVLTSVITRTATGTDSVIRFNAGALVQALADTEKGNAYTLSLQSKMTSLFDVPVSLADPDGSNVMIDFGSISNALIDAPEDPEEEDAGEQDAADGNPTIEDIIDDEELAEEEPTGETTGEDAWTWFESTAESTGAAVSSQVLRFDLSAMPVGATLAIADLKIEPGAMATPWKKSIKEVDETAATAQSTADDAKTLAAKTNQHFWTNDEGAHITTTPQGEAISGGNTLITGEGMDVRDGNTTLASFKKDGAVIGANNTQKIGITDKAFEAANAEGKIAARISSEYGMEVITETEGLFDPSMTGTLVLSFAPVAGSAITVSDNGSSVTFTQGTAETKAMTTEFGTYTITYDGDRTFTGTIYAKFTYRSSQPNGKVLSLADGAISAKWNGNFYARKVYSRDFSIRGQSLTDLFSGTISIDTTSTGALSISAGGNTGDTAIEVSHKDGYNASCIVGWDMSGTGASKCTISKLYINQSKQQIHYYIKNTGSAKATPTLRIYVLYTKNN